MPVQLTTSDYLLWLGSLVLEVVLCALIVGRGLYRRLPLFSTYLALVLACDCVGLWVYRQWGYGSWAAWYFAWISQGVIFLARSGAVAELCWSSLRAYRGIWALTWRLLCGIAVLLLLSAALDVSRKTHRVLAFVLTVERGLELAAVVLLLTLLLLSAYYRIGIQPVAWMITLGLCLYSLIQVLNNSFMQEWLTKYVFFWNGVRIVSYQAVLFLWLLALWKPLPAAAPAPTLLPQRVYDELSPQVNYRVRVLNERLLELLKS